MARSFSFGKIELVASTEEAGAPASRSRDTVPHRRARGFQRPCQPWAGRSQSRAGHDSPSGSTAITSIA